MKEAVRLEAGNITSAQIAVMRISENITKHILDQRPRVLMAILERRLNRETLRSIAKAEESALSELGAITHWIRSDIVRRLCKEVLSQEAENTVVHQIRSRAAKKRKPSFTQNEHQKSKEARQIHKWKDDMNAVLMHAATTTLHPKGSYHPGKPDWKTIAADLNKRFETDFTPIQWMGRYQHLQKYMPTSTTSEDTSS